MLLDRFGLNVPDGLETEGVRPNMELRLCVFVVFPEGGVAGTVGDRDGVCVGAEGASRRNVVGVRTFDPIEGLGVGATRVDEGVRLGWLGWLGLLNDGCRCTVGVLGDGVDHDRFGVEGVTALGADRLGVDQDRLGVGGVTVLGADGLGVGRLMLGDGLRVGARLCEKLRLREPSELLRLICILGCEGRVMRGLTDRLGLVEGLDMILRLPRDGRLRCGVGRGAD